MGMIEYTWDYARRTYNPDLRLSEGNNIKTET